MGNDFIECSDPSEIDKLKSEIDKLKSINVEDLEL